MAIVLSANFEAPYETVISVAPGIRRLLARNPSPFTYKGTGVAIVGHGPVAVIDPGPDEAEHLAALKEALKNENRKSGPDAFPRYRPPRRALSRCECVREIVRFRFERFFQAARLFCLIGSGIITATGPWPTIATPVPL